MALSEPVERVRRLGGAPRAGAIVLAEQAVDRYVNGYTRTDDRGIALDILLRDFARLRFQAPELDAFISAVESYIDRLHRRLSHQAA